MPLGTFGPGLISRLWVTPAPSMRAGPLHRLEDAMSSDETLASCRKLFRLHDRSMETVMVLLRRARHLTATSRSRLDHCRASREGNSSQDHGRRREELR